MSTEWLEEDRVDPMPQTPEDDPHGGCNHENEDADHHAGARHADSYGGVADEVAEAWRGSLASGSIEPVRPAALGTMASEWETSERVAASRLVRAAAGFGAEGGATEEEDEGVACAAFRAAAFHGQPLERKGARLAAFIASMGQHVDRFGHR